MNLSNYQYLVKANVAIATLDFDQSRAKGAVTSYARIHMIPFKVDGYCVYSDTDSVFTTKKLDSKFLGKGYMKAKIYLYINIF
jgi:hypothetical protein